MGRYKCSADMCESSSESDVKFFKFPLCNSRKLKKWLSNMKCKDWTPSRFSVLCINHFEEKHIDRTGKCVTLREDAVPTIFQPPDVTKKRKKVSTDLGNKKVKIPRLKASQTNPALTSETTKANVQTEAPSDTEEQPSGDSQKPERWRIIVDHGLMKINSFPHFFHGDYCIPQDIQWAPDDNCTTDGQDPENIIEVKEAWQWLGLDVRGPLPQTVNGHKYVLTVTDFFSKWVEALPMELCLPVHVAKHIVDIISHFGFPFRILSRLPHDIVQKINKELKDRLKVGVALLVHHHQTGSADLITQQLIDRMINSLVDDHAADWDVYLPAKVFSLCFKEHSSTKQRPFSLLCCQGIEPVKSPRGLTFTYAKIRDSVFVVG